MNTQDAPRNGRNQARGRGSDNNNNNVHQPRENQNQHQQTRHADPNRNTEETRNISRNESRQDNNRQNNRPPRGGASNDNRRQVDETATKASFSVSANTASAATAVSAPSATAAANANASFDKLGLMPELLKAVTELGYKAPTPIQQQAIPKVLDGKDVLAGAQTGTGKTAAFGLPIFQLLSKKYIVDGKAPAAPRGGNPIRVLVLTPTRELAAQVNDNFRDLSKYLPQSFFTTTVIVGGVSQGPQVTELRKRPTVLVATPGRLLDFHGQGGIVDLSKVEFCVLDEADRMLDMGFYPDVSKILALLPKEKQSLLFSATFTPDIRQLAGKILRNPIAEVQVTPPNSTVERIQQSYYLVSRDAKDEALTHIIQTNKWDQVLVFTRTKGGANHVSSMLAANKITSLALHGGKSQTARTTALADFKSGKLRVLVATDIAARGLDIEDLPHVVNYEIPNVPEDYVHRIGRTGRAGKEGFAVSLVCLDEEGFLNNILKFAGKADIPRKTDLPAAFDPAKNEKAEPIAMGRMTLWGGAGPVPPKSVMDAAGREKRREIANNIRERKGKERDARAAKEARRGGGGAPQQGGRGRGGQNSDNGFSSRNQERDGGRQFQQGGRGGGQGGDKRPREGEHQRYQDQAPRGGRPEGNNRNNNNNNNTNNNGGRGGYGQQQQQQQQPNGRGRGAPRGGRA